MRDAGCGSDGRTHLTASNSAFVSYRRDPGYASAKLIWKGLREGGIDAFLDLESMNEAGNFDAKILNQISGRPYFVIVLTEGTLDRCANPGDWLWRELDFAVTQSRIIVPAMIPPFDIADADEFLPSPAVADTLKRSNGVTFPPAFFDAAVQQLVGRLRPTELTLRAFSPDDRDFARRAANEVEHRSDERDQSSWTRHRVILVIAACVVLLGLVGLLLVAGRDDTAGSADSTLPTSTPPSGSNSTTTESTSTAPAVVESQLSSGEVLEAGQRLTSINGRHVLEMTADGRLVASTDGREWWSRPNPGHIGAVARMQNDGNLVVYKSASSTAPADSLWASETQDYPGASLYVEDVEGRGMIAIYAQDGARVFREVDRPTTGTTKSTQPGTTVSELTVPAVGGLSSEHATAQLEGEPYLLDVTVSSEPNEEIPAGFVIGTNPPAGANIDVGDSIEIVVSAGALTVPDVEHLTEAEARQILNDAGLNARISVQDLPAGDPRDGTVIDQSPNAGDPAKVGDDVSLRVGRAVVIG